MKGGYRRGSGWSQTRQSRRRPTQRGRIQTRYRSRRRNGRSSWSRPNRQTKYSERQRVVASPITNQPLVKLEKGGYVNGPACVLGDSGVEAFLWLASAGAKTKSEIFLRGLRERVSIGIEGWQSWRWRRICFLMKGEAIKDEVETGRLYLSSLDGTGVAARVVNHIGGVGLSEILFKGSRGKDYTSEFDAGVSRDQVRVVSDKTRTLRPKRAGGDEWDFTLWHPVNQQLVFDGKSVLSVDDRRGGGDLYVVDFLECASGSAASRLLFGPTATLYWRHEK